MIERWPADAMHTPILLAHRQHSPPRCFRCREMQVAELRQRITHSVIYGSLAYFAALYMRHRYSERERDRSGSQHFVAVCDEEQQIRPQPSEHVGESQCGHADSLRHAYISIRTEQAFDPFVNSETIPFDFIHGVPKLRRQVRA